VTKVLGVEGDRGVELLALDQGVPARETLVGQVHAVRAPPEPGGGQEQEWQE
jgi:hypothetical protein